MIESLSDHTSSLVERLLLFYRYMLPCVTAEAYSWADPENEDFGFKSGQENQTFVSWITFPPRYGRDLEKMIDWLLGMVSSSYWRSRGMVE